jgi:hypothetical protein
MGRAGRYTLSVMAWVAAYAGWSSLIGLVIAAATGDKPRQVSVGASAAFTVLGPVVPTLVALWFNDWARDGFPTREQRRSGAQRGGAAASVGLAPLRSSSRPTDAAAPPPDGSPADTGTRSEHDGGAGVEPSPQATGFPVAPLLRDRLDLD